MVNNKNTSEKGLKGAEAVKEDNRKRMKEGQASRMGKNSRKFENEVASRLPFTRVFLPQEVCDRITIVDGYPILIEIKHKGEKLRPKQRLFKNLVRKSSYMVVEE